MASIFVRVPVDQAGMALPSPRRPVARPDVPRGQGQNSRCNSRPLGRIPGSPTGGQWCWPKMTRPRTATSDASED